MRLADENACKVSMRTRAKCQACFLIDFRALRVTHVRTITMNSFFLFPVAEKKMDNFYPMMRGNQINFYPGEFRE